MDPAPALADRHHSWWLGGAPTEVRAFLAEEFAETHKGLQVLMGIGAGMFLLRGVMELWASGGLLGSGDLAFRVAGALFFATLCFLYGRVASISRRGAIFCLYLFAYVSATTLWVPLAGLHVGYVAVPIVLCLALAILMWPLVMGLCWPVLAVVVPAFAMLKFTHAGPRDWVSYGFFFLISLVFFITVRRARLRTAFALFVFRANLRNKADRDPLTGLLNRAGWCALAKPLWAAALAQDRPAAILFFDIDHFKVVNDDHGHAVGDRVLVQVARALEAGLPAGAVLGRIGGEEFVVALPATDAAAALEIANILRAKVRDARTAVPIAISAGVADRAHGADLSEVMHAADLGLLDAKRSGRNQARVASGLLGRDAGGLERGSRSWLMAPDAP